LGAGVRDAELRELVLTSPVTVPVGGWEGRVVSAPRDGVAGAVRLQIEISAGAQPPRAVWVTADIARWVPVVVARRALARGEILSAADVEIDRRDLAALPRDVATDLSDVVGSAVRQSIVPFAPLRRDQLATVAVVRRGDAVQIIAQSGGLRITAAGEVRHDARRGEQVRVLNRASQREVLARVRDGSTVEVAF
jgi:flagellar basal body P-ring formation protein FlgA